MPAPAPAPRAGGGPGKAATVVIIVLLVGGVLAYAGYHIAQGPCGEGAHQEGDPGATFCVKDLESSNGGGTDGGDGGGDCTSANGYLSISTGGKLVWVGEDGPFSAYSGSLPAGDYHVVVEHGDGTPYADEWLRVDPCKTTTARY